MRIKLEKRDPLENSELIKDMGADQDEFEIYPGGVSIDYRLDEIYESVATPETLALIVSFTGQAISSVGINIFSSWLWDKLTKHKVKITTIDGADMHFNEKGELESFLAKKITIEERT